MVNVNLFSQILSEIPRDKFQKSVAKYQADKHSKGITPWAHFAAMLFCHLSGADSLRAITGGLLSSQGNLNHMGIEQAPSKSNLAYLNCHRDYRLFQDLYFILLDHLCQKYSFARARLKRLKRPIYLIDATIIPLCLELFDWAKYRTKKGAAKLHLVLDYDGCLPVFANLTEGKTNELKVAKTMSFPEGSLLIFDRGYVDFKWLNVLDSNKQFFVTRAKQGMAFYEVKSNTIPPDKVNIVREDKVIELSTNESRRNYPKKLRFIIYWDSTTNQELAFLTNNFSWSAQTVADCYKERWKIEVFFKQLKQQLNIKSFVGTSENAVQIQVWTALIAMLLMKFMQEKSTHNWNLSNMVAFIRLHLLVKTNLWQWLNEPYYKQKKLPSGQIALEFSSA